MSSQRSFPFLGGIFGAFKTPRTIQTSKAASSAATSSTPSSQSHGSSPSQPRSITTTSKGTTSTALSALHSPRTHSTSPLSRSPGPSTSADSTTAIAPRYMKTNRRGSDSSSEGFRDVLGQEKWYVGGKTATGEERYFKLGVVRRQRSGDRLSMDQLSL